MSTTVFAMVDGHALGGLMRIVVTRPSGMSAARAAADAVVAAIDLAASRFREDSELSRLNASADQDVVVSPLLAAA
ncbi:MAG TPA: FAD:protein FMN transferase, partial [Candidatus Dormibacteraeota bacterium]